MFLSGNEIYWRTRWETSIDGSGTPFRTMVCYKDTKETSQIDPVMATGTWRDPRYAGFLPENELSGTMYVGQGADLPVQVTADQGKQRMWRNTRLASLTPGSTTSVGTDLVGYEFDGSPDNGFAPAGQIFASTTTASVPEILQDFGNQTAPGTLTHHFSLYRAASGALVFGAGTIQYAWGLDANHDLSTHAALVEVQQATINLLADMGVQPSDAAGGPGRRIRIGRPHGACRHHHATRRRADRLRHAGHRHGYRDGRRRRGRRRTGLGRRRHHVAPGDRERNLVVHGSAPRLRRHGHPGTGHRRLAQHLGAHLSGRALGDRTQHGLRRLAAQRPGLR